MLHGDVHIFWVAALLTGSFFRTFRPCCFARSASWNDRPQKGRLWSGKCGKSWCTRKQAWREEIATRRMRKAKSSLTTLEEETVPEAEVSEKPLVQADSRERIRESGEENMREIARENMETKSVNSRIEREWNFVRGLPRKRTTCGSEDRVVNLGSCLYTQSKGAKYPRDWGARESKRASEAGQIAMVQTLRLNAKPMGPDSGVQEDLCWRKARNSGWDGAERPFAEAKCCRERVKENHFIAQHRGEDKTQQRHNP